MVFAAGSMESTVPDTVMTPPGIRVREPMTKFEAEFSVYTEFPIVKPGFPATEFCRDWSHGDRSARYGYYAAGC